MNKIWNNWICDIHIFIEQNLHQENDITSNFRPQEDWAKPKKKNIHPISCFWKQKVTTWATDSTLKRQSVQNCNFHANNPEKTRRGDLRSWRLKWLFTFHFLASTKKGSSGLELLLHYIFAPDDLEPRLLWGQIKNVKCIAKICKLRGQYSWP